MKNSYHRESGTGNVFILLMGMITGAIGLLTLFGWILQIPLLTSYGITLVPMAPSTALLFVLMGFALSLHRRMPQTRGSYMAGATIGLLVTVVGILLFFTSYTEIYHRIEHLGFSITDTLNNIPLGHMSPATAFWFVVCAIAFLLTHSRSVGHTVRARIAFGLSVLVIFTSLLFLIAYLFVSPLMYDSGIIPPSLPTSLAFLSLAIGLLASGGLKLWQYDRIKDAATSRVSYILLSIFLVLTFGFVTSGYFVFRNYEKNYRAEIENQLSAIAESKVDQLTQWRKERIGDGQIFYKNDMFSDIVNRYLQNPNSQTAKTRILTWMGQVQRAFSYDLIMLLDTQFNTKLVFPENRERGRLVIDKRNKEILLSGNMVFQDFYRNEQDDHVYLNILVPILTHGSPKRIIGVLALRIDPTQYLYPLIEKWPTPSKTSETLIIRRDGNDALFLNNLKFRKDAALNLRMPLERKDVLGVKAVLGIKGIVEGKDYRGEQVIGNVRAVPGSPWFMVARMDKSEVYAPVRERLWLMIVLVGALLIGSGASVGFVWWQQRNRFYREQYKSAEALRESQELLESITDNSTSLIYIIDLEGRFLLMNRSLESLFSMPRGKVLGQTREIVMPKEIAEIHQKNDLEVIHSGKASIFEEENFEHDGRHVYLTIKFPLFNAEKKIYAIGGISTDITERKAADEVIKNMGLLLNETQEITKVGGWEYDIAKGKVTWTDEVYRIYGVSKEYDPGNLDQDISFYAPDDQRKLDTAFKRAVEIGEPYDLDLQLFNAAGMKLWVRTMGKAEKRDSKIVRVYGNIMDITDRKHAEEEIHSLNAELEQRVLLRTAELEASNKELEAFSYSVSHDLRAPLRHVSGYVDLLTKLFPDSLPPKARHYLDSIADSAHRMGVLIDDLLKFSRTGRLEMHETTVDMNVMAKEVTKQLHDDFPQRNIEWTIAQLPFIHCDPKMLHLVWENLLGNAVKFTRTRTHAEIEIGTREESKEFIFFVRDNGVGFDTKYAQKLFGVFQRLHRADEFEGTGIGLANVHRIITRHGGRTWAEAEPDKGATFYFTLPK